MIKYITRAFKITNENIILTTPLVLFLFILSIYLEVAKNAPQTVVSAILLLVTILFMLSAFFAGWLFMIKRAVELDKQEFIIDEDKSKASFNLIKELPVGVGEYFVPFIGALILYTGLFLLLLFISYQIGLHFIGKIGISFSQFKTAFSSPIAIKSMISAMSKEELIKLNQWDFLFVTTMAIFSFITMFWPAQIIIKNKNPLVAFFKSLKFTFKNFLPALILFVYLSFINFSVSIINTFAAMNPITYFISLLIYFYFLVYVVVLVFLYYDTTCCTKIEDEAQNNSDSGADSHGQEQSSNSESQGD